MPSVPRVKGAIGMTDAHDLIHLVEKDFLMVLVGHGVPPELRRTDGNQDWFPSPDIQLRATALLR